MFLECNNHEAHGPTDYHAYATISNRQKQFLWTYVMYVLTSATDSFNIHTRLHAHMSVHCGYRDMMSVRTCAGIGLKFHTT